MSIPDPEPFCREWAQAWNNRDLEGVLRHFHDDVVFTSPVAAQLLPGSNGVVRGKEALRAYWSEGLLRVPDLHFVVEAVYAGVNTLVIHYRNHKGILVKEVLIFEGALVKEGHGTYPMAAKNPSGVVTR
jgi:ketosteroid isomerase-like protein